jgi:hypothetical protein
MDFNREKIFELGKSFDLGLVSFDALSDSEKYALNRYYALKNEQLDLKIKDVTSSLNAINTRLDNVSGMLKEIK